MQLQGAQLLDAVLCCSWLSGPDVDCGKQPENLPRAHLRPVAALCILNSACCSQQGDEAQSCLLTVVVLHGATTYMHCMVQSTHLGLRSVDDELRLVGALVPDQAAQQLEGCIQKC